MDKFLSLASNIVNPIATNKFIKERDFILVNNRELHNQISNLKAEYKEKGFDIEWKYKRKIIIYTKLFINSMKLLVNY